ncbi:MAG: chromosome partitioning protein ParA, partial [Bacteroidaceae bacterium]|nr:chromosome partitioning protein ParA [Bacteroidaceae bacterium]
MTENDYKGQNEPKVGVDIVDVLYLCLSKWYWFVLSLLICLGLGTLHILRTKPTYSRYTSVLVKGTQGKGGSVDQQLSSIAVGRSSNLNNEILTFQAPSLTADVVKRLNLDVNYSTKGMFHDKTLYGRNLPIQVQFLSLTDEDQASVDVTFDAEGNVTLTNFSSNQAGEDSKNKVIKGKMRQVINTPVGRVMVSPTKYFAAGSEHTIQVYRSTKSAAVARYNTVGVSMADQGADILNMTFVDVSTERAEDVLRTLIDVYNESWLADKNQVALNTSKFINERLRVLQSELGSVDKSISSYQSSNLIPDAEAASQIYMQKSSQNSDRLMELNNQLYMARYVSKLVSSGKKSHELLPANSGINSGAIEAMIAEYNTNVLQRNRLVTNSTSSNPLIEDLDERINNQKQAIVTSLQNLVLTIETQIRG